MDSYFDRASRILGVASSFAVILITLAIVFDVVGRYFLNAPIDGASEFAVTSMIAVVYFGLMAAQRNNGNFRVDMLVRALPRTAQQALEIVWRAVAAGVLILLSWLSTMEAINSAQMGEASFGTIAFPIWPSRILLAIGLWALSAQIVLEFVQHVRNFGRPERA